MKLRIKEVCQMCNTTQKELAEKLGVSEVTLSRAANGSTSLPLLEKIAGVLGVEVSELFAAPKEGVIHCPPLNRRTQSPARIAANLSRWRRENKLWERKQTK